jgi:glycerophosphoryl diester phosphodiesterase
MKDDKNRIGIGGHRGYGCTDEEFYQDVRGVCYLPEENTIEGIAAGFNAGADFVELDMVMSQDEIIFLLHKVIAKYHFFEAKIPPSVLNHMDFAEIEKYKSGRKKQNSVTKFSDALNVIQKMDPKTLPWSLCVEIKGVQGTNQPYEDNNFIEVLADTVRQSGFPEERIIWSSFSLQNILQISHYFPKSAFAMLFTESDFFQKIYSNKGIDVRYIELPFEKRFIDQVIKIWSEEAHKDARLDYVHPEIMTITPEKMDYIYDLGLSINTWAYKEKWLDLFINQYKKIISYAREKNYRMNVITDFVDQMKIFQN